MQHPMQLGHPMHNGSAMLGGPDLQMSGTYMAAPAVNGIGGHMLTPYSEGATSRQLTSPAQQTLHFCMSQVDRGQG